MEERISSPYPATSCHAGSTITPCYEVIYDDCAAASNKPLRCLVLFGGNVTSSARAFTIDWDAADIARVTVI